MLHLVKPMFVRLLVLTPLALCFLLLTSIVNGYAEDDHIYSTQDFSELSFSLTSVTLSLIDLPVGSIELSSTEISEHTTDLHLLTPEFTERLNLITALVEQDGVSIHNALADFITGRAFTALSANNVIVGNYNYIYGDASAAVDVMERIKIYIESNGTETIPQYTSDSQIAIKLLGNEGDSIYWYISTKGNVLIVLHANGIVDQETLETFESSVTTVMGKEIATVSSRIYLPILQSRSSGYAEDLESTAALWRGPAHQVAFTHNDPSWVPHYGA